MPCPVEYLLQPLLSICAGLVGTHAEVAIKTGWVEPLILWTALVAPPGSKKSPAQKVLKSPLGRLQARAKVEYDQALIDYEAAKKAYFSRTPDEQLEVEQPVEPTMRDYFMERATVEAIGHNHAETPNHKGFPVIKDELSGWFSGMNQYKGGRGDDEQFFLSIHSGGDLKINLKGQAKKYIAKTSVSITGCLTPSGAEKLMGDPDDGDGMFGRFLFSAPTPEPAFWSELECDISDFLEAIYMRLDSLPEVTYHLATDARAKFAGYHDELVGEHSRSDAAMQNALSKMQGYTGRIALLLHLLDWACNEAGEISPQIPASTMDRAIALSKYYVSQIKLLRGTTLADDALDSAIPAKLMKIIEEGKRLGSLTPREVSQKKWASASEAKAMFFQLEEMGYGRVDVVTRGNRESVTWLFSEPIPSTHPEPPSTHPEPPSTHPEPIPPTATPKKTAVGGYAPKKGDSVKKRHQRGWTGTVEAVFASSGEVDVLWTHAKNTERIQIQKLAPLAVVGD